MDRYKHRVLALKTAVDHHKSYDISLEVYSWHRPCEWAAHDSACVFEVGNAIARFRPDLVSVGIRLNVQVNLFLKSIQRFGTPKRFQQVDRDDGCFALTERSAGVLSGMVVKTTFEEVDGGYVLHTETESAEKCWISQGIHSTWTLCVAGNRKDARDVRLFLISSKLGTRIEMSVGEVQISHTVDLCIIRYDSCLVSKESVLEGSIGMNRRILLSGICHGRYMIAEAVVQTILCLCDRILALLAHRPLDKRVVVEDIPSIRDFRDATSRYARHLVQLRCNGILLDQPELVPLYKVACTEWAIEAHVNLHMRFATYAMQAGITFETLILNKLAEGDTDVLRLSMIVDDARTNTLSRLFRSNSRIRPASLYDYIRVGWSDRTNAQKMRTLSSVIMKDNIMLPPESSRCFDGFIYSSSL